VPPPVVKAEELEEPLPLEEVEEFEVLEVVEFLALLGALSLLFPSLFLVFPALLLRFPFGLDFLAFSGDGGKSPSTRAEMPEDR
jgi:hypothetical protein